MIKLKLFEILKSPKSVCNAHKGFISPTNQIVGAYIYGDRGLSPQNIIIGANLTKLKTSDFFYEDEVVKTEE